MTNWVKLTEIERCVNCGDFDFPVKGKADPKGDLCAWCLHAVFELSAEQLQYAEKDYRTKRG